MRAIAAARWPREFAPQSRATPADSIETKPAAATAASSPSPGSRGGAIDCCKPSTGRTADYQRTRNGRL
ncbi:hypothetical protein A33K_14293 [Burkholderia humptydooensis MSMB43]|uniref:Uncharacterized protein n=1 Tax=Burkholderia humptydooensis MSMB43 TaxID=441157 RepID=A0ABN0G7N4_9BURK|nr:hypothetical protein A33K_14293 [Burkholderia humptydooensis MSMB43]